MTSAEVKSVLGWNEGVTTVKLSQEKEWDLQMGK